MLTQNSTWGSRKISITFIYILFFHSPTVTVGEYNRTSNTFLFEKLIHSPQIVHHKTRKAAMDNTLLSILDSCMLDDTRETLLLSGEYDEFLRTHKEYLGRKNVALIGDHEHTMTKNSVVAKHSIRLDNNLTHLSRKLRIYIVFFSSMTVFQKIIRWIGRSNWSNNEGFYIFYDTNDNHSDCRRAYRSLWGAWEIDYLSALYLCYNYQNEVVVYTYNPYHNTMPEPWMGVNQFEGFGEHPWTLLKNDSNTANLSCEQLYFDKTRNLGGYEVKINAGEVVPFVQIAGNASSLEDFTGENSKTLQAVWQKLNVTPTITVYEEVQSLALDTTDSNGKPKGMYADIANGKSDMTMNFRYLVPKWNVRFTYPHAEGGLCVITQNSGYMSELTKLLQFLSPELVICIVAINLITLAIFSCVGGQNIALAGLNTLRLFVCVAMIPTPSSNIARMYLYTVIFMLMTINAIFQSHWSSILTVPVTNPNIDDIDDLQKSDHVIYGSDELRGIMIESSLLQRFRPIRYTDCKAVVLQDAKAACLTDCRHALYRISSDNLHYSAIVHKFAESYVTRATWPMYHRVNRMIQTLVETGLIARWRRIDLRPFRWHFRKQQIIQGRGYRVLRLDRLMFSFDFLIVGLGSAFVVFVLEIIIGRQRHHPIIVRIGEHEILNNHSHVVINHVRYANNDSDHPHTFYMFERSRNVH